MKVGDRAVGVEPVSDTEQFAVNAYPNPVTDYLYSTESTGDAKIRGHECLRKQRVDGNL